MRLTKFDHACVLVEVDGARVLVDPGNYSAGWDELTDLTAVLVTHQHPDHVDLERLPKLLERHRDIPVYADAQTVDVLGGAGIGASAVTPGDHVDVGFPVEVHGGEHAVIHPDIPRIANVGYLMAGRFFHPGDSLTVPDSPVEVLGLPTCSPWLKGSEAVDYLRAVAPRMAVPIHEALLARPQAFYALYERLAPEGTTVHVIPPGDSLELG